jgi:hypothetical protein
MSNILYVIDGYLSSKEKADVTLELIQQLKTLDSTRKIMLINKFGNSWGIDTQVDFYREYLDGFMVGYPPEEIINSNLYNKPYVYYEVNSGILENWMPYVGVTDHVANIYNGFIFSMQEANKLGYSKVFRIEYDMLFDEKEFNEVLNDLNNFETEDYLIYGKRKEGKWAGQHQSLIDVHFCGFSIEMVKNFSCVNNDQEYWDLCKKIGYFGKWAEYVLSMVFKYNMNENTKGKIYEGQMIDKFNKSQIDRLSSSGNWTDKWKDIPKICKLDVGGGHKTDPNKLVVFYLNKDYDTAEIEIVGTNGYYKQTTINRGCWEYNIIDRTDNMVFISKVTHKDGTNTYIKKINNENFDSINNRFILK